MAFLKNVNEDLNAIMEKDPAARNKIEVLLCYPGVWALIWHRPAHWFYRHKMKLLARMISQFSRFLNGIEIHPGATIGKRCFIDHGMGIVIGETAEVGDDVTLYQGVTLGGTGKDTGKRHPTIGNNVIVSSGAKVLGPFTVGDNSKIGAGSIVLNEVPPDCTVVGVPGKIVKRQGVLIDDMDQVHLPDPVMTELDCLRQRIATLEAELQLQNCASDAQSCVECGGGCSETAAEILRSLVGECDDCAAECEVPGKNRGYTIEKIQPDEKTR